MLSVIIIRNSCGSNSSSRCCKLTGDLQTTEERNMSSSTISTSHSVSSSTNRQSECEEWLDRGSSLYFVLRREDTCR